MLAPSSVIDETTCENGVGFPEGPAAFFDYIDKWRNSGDFEGLEFR